MWSLIFLQSGPDWQIFKEDLHLDWSVIVTENDTDIKICNGNPNYLNHRMFTIEEAHNQMSINMCITQSTSLLTKHENPLSFHN